MMDLLWALLLLLNSANSEASLFQGGDSTKAFNFGFVNIEELTFLASEKNQKVTSEDMLSHHIEYNNDKNTIEKEKDEIERVETTDVSRLTNVRFGPLYKHTHKLSLKGEALPLKFSQLSRDLRKVEEKTGSFIERTPRTIHATPEGDRQIEGILRHIDTKTTPKESLEKRGYTSTARSHVGQSRKRRFRINPRDISSNRVDVSAITDSLAAKNNNHIKQDSRSRRGHYNSDSRDRANRVDFLSDRSSSQTSYKSNSYSYNSKPNPSMGNPPASCRCEYPGENLYDKLINGKSKSNSMGDHSSTVLSKGITSSGTKGILSKGAFNKGTGNSAYMMIGSGTSPTWYTIASIFSMTGAKVKSMERGANSAGSRYQHTYFSSRSLSETKSRSGHMVKARGVMESQSQLFFRKVKKHQTKAKGNVESHPFVDSALNDGIIVDGHLVLPRNHAACRAVQFVCPGDTFDGPIWNYACPGSLTVSSAPVREKGADSGAKNNKGVGGYKVSHFNKGNDSLKGKGGKQTYKGHRNMSNSKIENRKLHGEKALHSFDTREADRVRDRYNDNTDIAYRQLMKMSKGVMVSSNMRMAKHSSFDDDIYPFNSLPDNQEPENPFDAFIASTSSSSSSKHSKNSSSKSDPKDHTLPAKQSKTWSGEGVTYAQSVVFLPLDHVLCSARTSVPSPKDDCNPELSPLSSLEPDGPYLNPGNPPPTILLPSEPTAPSSFNFNAFNPVANSGGSKFDLPGGAFMMSTAIDQSYDFSMSSFSAHKNRPRPTGMMIQFTTKPGAKLTIEPTRCPSTIFPQAPAPPTFAPLIEGLTASPNLTPIHDIVPSSPNIFPSPNGPTMSSNSTISPEGLSMPVSLQTQPTVAPTETLKPSPSPSSSQSENQASVVPTDSPKPSPSPSSIPSSIPSVMPVIPAPPPPEIKVTDTPTELPTDSPKPSPSPSSIPSSIPSVMPVIPAPPPPEIKIGRAHV